MSIVLILNLELKMYFSYKEAESIEEYTNQVADILSKADLPIKVKISLKKEHIKFKYKLEIQVKDITKADGRKWLDALSSTIRMSYIDYVIIKVTDKSFITEGIIR